MHLKRNTTEAAVAVEPSTETGGGPAVAMVPLPEDSGAKAPDNGLLRAAKLTVPDASRAIGIGETKMRQAISEGKIPVIRVLGKVLILERDLEAFLVGHYGTLRMVERSSTASMAPLPSHVRESLMLKKKAS